MPEPLKPKMQIMSCTQMLSLQSFCQDPRPGLDRFSPVASLGKKGVAKRPTKPSQRLGCLSYYLVFHDRNTFLMSSCSVRGKYNINANDVRYFIDSENCSKGVFSSSWIVTIERPLVTSESQVHHPTFQANEEVRFFSDTVLVDKGN